MWLWPSNVWTVNHSKIRIPRVYKIWLPLLSLSRCNTVILIAVQLQTEGHNSMGADNSRLYTADCGLSLDCQYYWWRWSTRTLEEVPGGKLESVCSWAGRQVSCVLETDVILHTLLPTRTSMSRSVNAKLMFLPWMTTTQTTDELVISIFIMPPPLG